MHRKYILCQIGTYTSEFASVWTWAILGIDIIIRNKSGSDGTLVLGDI